VVSSPIHRHSEKMTYLYRMAEFHEGFPDFTSSHRVRE